MADTPTRADLSETPESKYPLQFIKQFSGGHRMWVGNERGKEFVRLMHPSGSYMEIKPDGGVTHFNVGQSKNYNKGGVTLSVDENNDVQISGHNKLQVGGGAHIEVAGDVGIAAGGNIALAGLGDMGMAVKGNLYMGVQGKASFNAQGGFEVKTPNFKVEADASADIKAAAITLDGAMNFKGDIEHTGNMNTSGIHVDSIGQHDA